MLTARFVQETITIDNLSFSLDGKIEPKFFNTGDTSVRINNVMIQPFESFSAGFTGMKSSGRISIEFLEAGKNRVDCFYGIEQTETKCD